MKKIQSTREDILLKYQMENLGWQAEMSNGDKLKNRLFPIQEPYRFVKDNTNIWWTAMGWQVADLIDGFYTNHRGIVSPTTGGYKGDRYNRGFIPDLKTVIELIKKDDL